MGNRRSRWGGIGLKQLRLSVMQGMLKAMSGVSTGLLAKGLQIIFPPSCVFCNRPVSEGRCCDHCASEIQVMTRHVCQRCGRPLAEDLVPGPCGHCLASPPPQEETVSLFVYAGPVRRGILAWKLEGRDAGLIWLLNVARPRLCELFGPEDLLLPVPMPLKRMRRSGQHHAADLCRHIAGITGCRWEWRLLRRHGEQARQSSLRSSARWRNLRGAFSVDMRIWRSLSIRGSIWIVDDIHTTGATLRFAGRALASLQQPVSAFALSRVASKR